MAEPKGSLTEPPTPSQWGENASVFPGLQRGCWENGVLGRVMADSNRPMVRQVLAVTDAGSCSVAIVLFVRCPVSLLSWWGQGSAPSSTVGPCVGSGHSIMSRSGRCHSQDRAFNC